ncbi:L-serine ammonia-lyase, iron-sulfur-dependent, subunit alpha [Megasphaera sp. WILCCON 0056]|uniref:L-serine ammonia-lyase, iron-sulfur-dependent, subunit alpha n=1 Tax=Megasphaera sp. WILCCON 0056 TaxID=3345340 RepID=UPI003A7FB447
MYSYTYRTLDELYRIAKQHQIRMAEVVINHELEMSNLSREALYHIMLSRIKVFRESIDAGILDKERSVSGLIGGDANKLLCSKINLLGTISHKAAIYALAVSEANAKMFRIVACPTAGSCGIVPAVLMAMSEYFKTSQKENVDALFMAAGIGAVVSRNASVAGAVGGCQAECGTAAAMAAAIAAQLAGGSDRVVLEAMALCMKNTLGLACDPVAGLVEVPCVKRNACLAIMAIGAAEMALSGICSVIPPDEVISAMAEIGRMMPVALKETSEGGLAHTETGKKIARKLEKM